MRILKTQPIRVLLSEYIKTLFLSICKKLYFHLLFIVGERSSWYIIGNRYSPTLAITNYISSVVLWSIAFMEQFFKMKTQQYFIVDGEKN